MKNSYINSDEWRRAPNKKEDNSSVEFINWMCEKAESFEIGLGRISYRMGGWIPIGSDIFEDVYYPFLMQKAIEGVNREHQENSGKSPMILIDAYDLEVKYLSNRFKDFDKGLDCWDSIDHAKESALLYIYEQELNK